MPTTEITRRVVPAMRVLPALTALIAMLSLAGCAARTGNYVWVQDYAPPPAAADTAAARQRIGPGDLVAVHVWNADQLTTRQRVREDGTLSLFFAGDVHVAGLTPAEATESIARHLTGFVQSPRVNVVLEESAASKVSVLGEVSRPGSYPVASAATLLQALAAAEGLTEYAHRDRIYVLRQDGDAARIRVDYDELVQGDLQATRFALRPGDVVVVE